MATLLQDLKYGLRMLARNPGFTAVAVLTLALGIGANAAIFTLINALLLRELPVREPGRLVALTAMARSGYEVGLSYSMFEEIKRHQQVFSRLFAYSDNALWTLETGGIVSAGTGMIVTGDFYSTLGVPPLIGRIVTPADADGKGGTPARVAVISYACWQARYGGSPEILGKEIRVEGVPLTIIGVTPRAFSGLTVGYAQDVTLPVGGISGDPRKMTGGLKIMGRLKDGITLEQARGELQALWPGLLEATVPPDLNVAQRKEVLSERLEVASAATGFSVDLRRQFSRPLFVLMGLAGFVLLIACANIASLMLARAAARGHEMGVRIALGASGWRLVRQLLTEGVLLSLTGATVALPLAYLGSHLLLNFVWTSVVPRTLDLGPDLRILGFTASAAVATGILFGLAPAWDARRADPIRALQHSLRTVRGGAGRLGKLLVSTQVTLSLILLVGTLLFARSLEKLRSLHLGFRSESVLLVHLTPQPGGYKNLLRVSYYRELIERLSGLPAVRSVSLSYLVPVIPAALEFKEPVSLASGGNVAAEPVGAEVHITAPRFFETLGISLLQGRDFEFGDNEHALRVAIISQSLGRRFFPSGDALGREISVGTSPEHQNLRIIGIVNDATLQGIRVQKPLAVYLPFFQERVNSPVALIRTHGKPSAIAMSVRRQIEALGREHAFRVVTLNQQIDQALLQERVMAMLSGFFGALALLLASIGLYGLMSYAVTCRTGEIGVRMAIGAQARDVLWMVLRETFLLVLVGVAAGIPAAWATGRLVSGLISGLLFGLSSTDSAMIALASFLMIVAAGFAGYLPARRATKVDPMVALRYE